MLILDRRPNEQVVIGDEIVLTILEVRGGKVRIGIAAPVEISIIRDELLDRRQIQPAKDAKWKSSTMKP
jgi:carbon storage regulator